MIVHVPPEAKRSAPLPLCIVFHGNDSSPEIESPFWKPLSDSGWLVALPQSARSGSQPGAFIWSRPGFDEWDFDEALAHLQHVMQAYPVDPRRIVLAGFSMGGGMAIEMVLKNLVQALGFIGVAPYISWRFVDPESDYRNLVKAHSARGVCIVGAEDDIAVEGTRALAARLPGVNGECLVEVHAATDHTYPIGFSESLHRAVAFLERRSVLEEH